VCGHGGGVVVLKRWRGDKQIGETSIVASSRRWHQQMTGPTRSPSPRPRMGGPKSCDQKPHTAIAGLTGVLSYHRMHGHRDTAPATDRGACADPSVSRRGWAGRIAFGSVKGNIGTWMQRGVSRDQTVERSRPARSTQCQYKAPNPGLTLRGAVFRADGLMTGRRWPRRAG